MDQSGIFATQWVHIFKNNMNVSIAKTNGMS